MWVSRKDSFLVWIFQHKQARPHQAKGNVWWHVFLYCCYSYWYCGIFWLKFWTWNQLLFDVAASVSFSWSIFASLLLPLWAWTPSTTAQLGKPCSKNPKRFTSSIQSDLMMEDSTGSLRNETFGGHSLQRGTRWHSSQKVDKSRFHTNQYVRTVPSLLFRLLNCCKALDHPNLTVSF